MSKRYFDVLPTALFATAVLSALAAPPLSEAQARIGAGRNFGISANRTPGMQRVHRPAILLGTPYFYSDYPSEPALQQPAPQIVVVHPPATAEPVKEAAPEPLMIEWQGDHYARLSAKQGIIASAKPVQLDYVETPAKPAVTLTRTHLSEGAQAKAAT